MNRPTIVAYNVKRLLRERKISQKNFAELNGISYKKLNNKLNGYESVYPEDIVFFYNSLDCDVNELFKPRAESAEGR